MSRGYGRHQKAVLDHLSRLSAPTTFETIRWHLWEDAAEHATAGQDLPNKWNTAVMRAVKGLEKDERVTIDRRRLVSLEECVQHYPNKTLSGAARRLRQQLLPVLLRWTQDGKVFPRYNLAANEKFHLQSLAPDARKALRADWLRLERRLVALLASPGRARRNAVFQLIAKGKSIFEIEELECPGAFVEHARRCAERQCLPGPLAAEMAAFSEAILPPTDAGHLRLKGYIHELVAVPRHRGCSLKKKTVEYLAEMCPAVVEKLPDYVPAEKPTDRRLFKREAKHSPQLYGLFDQTVFQTFHFLQLA
jgi:hypothetical protein